MEEFDLIIVGAGSGNAIPPELDDWRIALVEKDLVGGTCLNRGCIPSKMYVQAAEVASAVTEGERLGVFGRIDHVDWPGIVKRIFGRIDPIAAAGLDYRVNSTPNVTFFGGEGRLLEPKVLEVGGRRLGAPHVLLAAGSRPFLPPYPGLDAVPYHTSDTIMRLEQLPESLVILGGGYIAAELGYVLSSLGTEVTFVLRGPVMLSGEDGEVSTHVTEAYARRCRVITSAREVTIGGRDHELVVTGLRDRERFTVVADTLLVATGRQPNGDVLGAAEVGIETDGSRIVTDETLATNVPGVWALGDITNTHQLKHLANAEARVVFANIASVGREGDPAGHRHSRLRRIDRTLVPHAVFGNPQVATVGMRERDAHAAGIPYVCATQRYSDTAYGWALEDSMSFCKLVAHRDTRQLLGAHIMGPLAATLIQPLIQGMRFGQTVDEMASEVWYIHPAPTEIVENALLQL